MSCKIGVLNVQRCKKIILMHIHFLYTNKLASISAYTLLPQDIIYIFIFYFFLFIYISKLQLSYFQLLE